MGTFRDRLERALNRVGDLPVLPSALHRLRQALSDEKTSAHDVARVMEQDPSLTAKVLRVANSIYYAGTTGTVTSVKSAVARLGFSEVNRLFTTLAVIRTFDHMGSHLDHNQFWKHSLTAAITTRVIRRHCGTSDTFSEDDAYVAGLLHDIGLVILDQYFPALFVEVSVAAYRRCISRADAECRILGIGHGEIGGSLLRRWRIRASVAEAVTWHHQPEKAEPKHRTLVEVVRVADFVCTSLGIGDAADGIPEGSSDAGDGIPEGLSDVAWHDLGLSADDFSAIVQETAGEAVRSEVLVALVR